MIPSAAPYLPQGPLNALKHKEASGYFDPIAKTLVERPGFFVPAI